MSVKDKFEDAFSNVAGKASTATGSPWAFTLALGIVIGWALSGAIFAFSTTWQLVINTGTTIITFLMVFLIQNTQNRDAEAIQVKLDELIRLSEGGHNVLLDLEELEDEELNRIRENYCKIAEEAREKLRRGEGDTDTPEVEHEAEESLRRDLKRSA